jgi:hypothetical protein
LFAAKFYQKNRYLVILSAAKDLLLALRSCSHFLSRYLRKRLLEDIQRSVELLA